MQEGPVTERLKQRSGIEARPLPRGMLLVDMNSGRCFRLNQVGSDVWGMLSSARELSAICATLANRYGRPVGEIESDVGSLIAHLTREQLVEIVAAEVS